MSTPTQPEHLHVDWVEFNRLVRGLAIQIKHCDLSISGFYGIPRGGSYVALALSYELKLPLFTELRPYCMVVDDICDSGATLKRVAGGRPTAVMHYRALKSKTVPTFHVQPVGGQWVVYPWEELEKPIEDAQVRLLQALNIYGQEVVECKMETNRVVLELKASSKTGNEAKSKNPSSESSSPLESLLTPKS